MINSTLENKCAVVTGAGRGIGRSIAKILANNGAKVVLSSRSVEELNSVRQEIEGFGGTAYCIPADVANEQESIDLIRGAVDMCGRLDILVNNAGMGIYGQLANMKTEDWDKMMNVNVRAPFILSREAIPYLKKHERSFIVNIGSVVSVKGYENQSGYSASKHALLGMTKSLSREVNDLGIRVHAVCPGGVDTKLVGDARPDLDTSVLMQPDEIADVVLFLVTRKGKAMIDGVFLRRESSTPWA